MNRNSFSKRGAMPPHPLGGVPASVPVGAEDPRGQLALPMTESPTRLRHAPLAGAVHVAAWLDRDEQRALVDAFQAWALPPAGLRRPRVPSGHLMSVRSVCLGWHWQPYVYSRTADDTDRARVKPMPPEIVALARRAVSEAYGESSEAARRYAPDAAIVNLYEADARLGLHRDAEEPSDAPVVTISLGDTCSFRFAGVERRTAPFTDLELRSGDLLVFGGPARRIYHGVPKVFGGSGPADLGLRGRLSITVRETGLA